MFNRWMPLRWGFVILLTACATMSRGAITNVASKTEAAKACETAAPGDEIVLADGLYTDFQLVLKGRGEKNRPVVFRAAHSGKAVLTGQSQITMNGEYLAVEGLVFDQAWSGTVVSFAGATHCRLSHCAFIECGDPKSTYRHIVTFGGGSRENLAEHCYMQGSLSMGMGIQITPNNFENTNNRIAWNYFKDIKRRSNNGQEAVQIGQGVPADRTSQHTVVESNLFDNASGDAEIISNKSSDNVLRHNTFRNCRAMLVLRAGSHVRVEGNFFFNCAGGIRAYDAFHEIVNNYIEDCETGIYIPSGGVWDTGMIGYAAFVKGVVAHNTIVNCKQFGISVGQPNNHPATQTVLPVYSNDFLNNIVTGNTGEMIRDEGAYATTWRGNMVWPTDKAKAGLKDPGIVLVNPKLEQRDGIWRPALSDSPAIDPPSVNFRDVNAPIPGTETDIDGQKRNEKPDVGCDEISTAPMRFGPLAPSQVGPAWMAGDPSCIERIPNPKPIPVIKKETPLARMDKEPHILANAAFDENGQMVLEAENFRLHNGATVETLEGASGGKAVRLTQTDSQIEAAVSLEPGRYQVELYTQSQGSDHDAIYHAVAKKQIRSYRSEKGVGPTNSIMTVDIQKGGLQDVIVRAGETDVWADRVVIRFIK